jgi:hypothetical protein
MGCYIVPTITYIVSINKYNVVWDQTNSFWNFWKLDKRNKKKWTNHGGVRLSVGMRKTHEHYSIIFFAIDLVIHTRGMAQGRGHCKKKGLCKKGMCVVGVKCKPTFRNVFNQGALPKVKTCSNFLTRNTMPKVKKPIMFKAKKQKTLANKREEDTSQKTKGISLR